MNLLSFVFGKRHIASELRTALRSEREALGRANRSLKDVLAGGTVVLEVKHAPEPTNVRRLR